MKTLDEIINERLIVEDDGYTDGRVSLKSIKDICILAQQQALKNASDRVKIVKTGNSGSYFDASVDKQSILNEQNIVR